MGKTKRHIATQHLFINILWGYYLFVCLHKNTYSKDTRKPVLVGTAIFMHMYLIPVPQAIWNHHTHYWLYMSIHLIFTQSTCNLNSSTETLMKAHRNGQMKTAFIQSAAWWFISLQCILLVILANNNRKVCTRKQNLF